MPVFISSILQPLLAVLGTHFGAIGVVGAWGLAFVPIVTLLIELMQFVVSIINNKADEDFAKKVEQIWLSYVLPVLEVLPHANLPISATLLVILSYLNKGIAALKAAVNAWRNPPAPPSA